MGDPEYPLKLLQRVITVSVKAMKRLFETLHRFATVDVPGFQLVTEHANLRDEWFQTALAEEPWTKPPALVPDDWPDIPVV